MRGRSVRDRLLTCAGLAALTGALIAPDAHAASDAFDTVLSSKVPFAAEPLDANAIGLEGDFTAVDASDWKPEHLSTRTAAAPAAQAKATDPVPDPSADKSVDAADPEPDGVTVPKTQSPSHDPLDRLKPAVAAPLQTAPSKADPRKIDAAKPDAAKPDAAKPPQAAEEPLPASNAAIKAVVDKRVAVQGRGPGVAEERKERAAVAFFYAAHGFAPAWSENGKPVEAVASVLARLAGAEEDALSVPGAPKTLVTSGTPEEIAASDVALTEAVVAYARQATGSRIDPHSLSPLIGAKPDLADPAEVVDAVIAAGGGAGEKLRASNPSDPRYIALRNKLAELRGDRPALSDTMIPSGALLRAGMRDPRVPELRARLSVEAKEGGDDVDLLYDADLAAAVTKFQRAKGLVASGSLNEATVTALNGGLSSQPSRMEATLIANMEMWRWLPRDLGADRIEVNIPDYMVKVYHDNEMVDEHRVVVGKTDTPTPLFSNTMKFLIVNPVWNVPQSIIQNEFGGEARGFKARYVNGKLYLQQPAGPKNALGRIKFMFPNEYSVYLHDTPAKHLFGNSKRAYSHGCVRVDKPFEFAQSVLNDGVPEGGKVLWSVKRLEKMLGTTERYVDLPKPLPVHIAYFTASVDASGKVVTREDVYGYTAAVARSLGVGATVSPAPMAGSKSNDETASARQRRHYADDDGGSRRSRRRARRFAEEGAPVYAPPAAPQGPSFSQAFGFLPF